MITVIAIAFRAIISRFVSLWNFIRYVERIEKIREHFIIFRMDLQHWAEISLQSFYPFPLSLIYWEVSRLRRYSNSWHKIIPRSSGLCKDFSYSLYLVSIVFFRLFYLDKIYRCAAALINVRTLRLCRNKQNTKKEKSEIAFRRGSGVYNSPKVESLQQQPEVGSAFVEPKDIVNRSSGRQIDAGKSYCATFFAQVIATLPTREIWSAMRKM